MQRRTFVKNTGLALTAMGLYSSIGCGTKDNKPTDAIGHLSSPFSLPELPYALDALAPYIDAKTMEIHYGKHHAGYVKKLNKALENHPSQDLDLGAILSGITDAESDIAVRNNGGGHYNHSLFWSILTPNEGSQPTGQLAKSIEENFGSLENFLLDFSKEAATVFGSGWAWLIADSQGKLKITSTPNQDNPLMTAVVDDPGLPLLALDVWEHAYYLHYQNRRTEYIANFTKIIDWDAVSARFDLAM